MATIKIKKGSGAPVTLNVSEPAFDYLNNALYIGATAGGSPKWIGAEIDNGTLATNSQIKIPTQYAVKQYVDANVAGGAVSSINGFTGGITLAAGTGIFVTNSAKNITITNTGVQSLSVSNGGGISILGLAGTTGALSFTINNAGVTSINGQTGTITNVAFTNTANTFTIGNAFNAGVTASDLTVTNAATVGGNLSVTGNLTVNGTTTYVNSTVTEIADPIITLGWTGGVGGMPTDDNKDRGIAFKYNSSGGKTGFFGYDDSTGYFTFVPNATIAGEVVSGTPGTAQFNTLTSSSGVTLAIVSTTDTIDLYGGGTTNTKLRLWDSNPLYNSTFLVGSLTANQQYTLPNATGTVVVYGASGNTNQITTLGTITTGVWNASLIPLAYGGTNKNLTPIAGGIVYTDSDSMEVTAAGTADQILKSNVSSAPSWISPSSAGFTAYAATNVAGGAAGNLHYQTGATTTSFVSNAGVTGYFLTYNTTSNTPTWANPNTLGFTAYGSTVAVNLQGGAGGSLPYNTAANTTGFLSIGTINQVLTSSGSLPQWTSPNSAGFTAYAATHIAGGAQGSLFYNTAATTTTSLPIGTSGFVLTSSGTAPQWTAGTGITAGTAQTVTVASDVADTTCFVTFINTGTDGNASVKYNSSLTYNATTNYLEANIDGGFY